MKITSVEPIALDSRGCAIQIGNIEEVNLVSLQNIICYGLKYLRDEICCTEDGQRYDLLAYRIKEAEEIQKYLIEEILEC